MKITRGEIEELTKDEILESKCIGHRRWYSIHRIIFKHEEKLYEAKISQPLTEIQEMDWDDDDEIECAEVEPIEATVIMYGKRVI